MSSSGATTIGLDGHPTWTRLWELVLVLATTAGAMYVMVAGSFGVLGARVGYDLIAVGTLIPWFLYAAVRGRGMPRSHLTPAIAAILGAFAVSTVTSRVPRISLEMLGYAVLLAGLYLAAVALMRRPRLRAHVGALALVMCAAICVFYVVEVLLAWQTWWGLVGRFAIPPLRPGYIGFNLGSPNPLAELVLLLIGFGLGAVKIRGRLGIVVVVVLVSLVATVVFLTASRGAWLGAGVAIVAVGVMALASYAELRHRIVGLVRTRGGAVVTLALVLLVGLGGVAAALSGRLTLADNAREPFAEISLRMFEASPVAGTGPGTWPILRAAYTTPDQPDVYVPHAHSVYWQTIAELGIVGVLAGVVVAVAVGWVILRAIRSTDTSRRRMALAAVFGVVLLAVHQAVDMFMNVPGVLFAIGLPIAWLDATSDELPVDVAKATSRASRFLFPRLVPLASAGLIALIGTGLVVTERTTSTYLSAVDAADAGNWTQALNLAERAVDADPDIAAYQLTLGVASANAGDLQLAERALTKSTAADDYTYAWLDLAAVRWKLGDPGGARAALTAAERLGLQRPTVALPAGWLRLQLGESSAAIADFAAAIMSAPTLAADPFWNSNQDLRSVWPTIWSTAIASADARTSLELGLVASDADLAQRSAATMSESDPSLYAAVIDAWNGDPASTGALQALAVAHPGDADTLGWCQLIAEHQRDTASIDRFSRWITLNGSPFATLPQLAIVSTSTTRPMPPTVVDDYELLYRRPVPDAQIVELLPQVSWEDNS